MKHKSPNPLRVRTSRGKRLAAVGLAVLLAAAGSTPAQAFSSPSELSTPPIGTWSGGADFRSPNGPLPAPWGNPRGLWAVADGKAVQPTDMGDANVLFTGHELGSEFEVSAELTLTSGENGQWSGLVFNSDAAQSNRYVFRIAPATATRKPAWQVLHQSVASGLSVLANFSVDGAFSVGKTYTLTARSAGLNRVVVSAVDEAGNQRLTSNTEVALDPALRVFGPYGGIYSSYGGAEFGDFRLKTSDDKPGAATERFDSDTPGLTGAWSQGGAGTWGIESGRARLVDRSPGASNWNYYIEYQGVTLGRSFEVSADVIVDPEQPLAKNSPEDSPERGSTGISVNQLPGSLYTLRLISDASGRKSWQFIKNAGSGETLISSTASGSFDYSTKGSYRLTVVSSEPGVFDISIAPPKGGPAAVSKTVKDETGTPVLVGGNAGLFTARGNLAFDDFVVASSDSRGADRVTAVSCVGKTSAETVAQLSVLTRGARQYVAFYDEEGRMRVSQRQLDSSKGGNDCADADSVWSKTKVLDDFHSSYDAHRDITMAFDRSGRLHVMGGWHNSSLSGGNPADLVNPDGGSTGAYYRSDASGEVDSLTRQMEIVSRGADGSMTYPVFYTMPGGDLILSRRNGQSGAGALDFFGWNDTGARWAVLSTFNAAETDGVYGSVYPSNIVLDADGVFHMAWVWRTGPTKEQAANGNQNSHVSYATTKDFRTWTSVTGDALSLPFRPDGGASLVDNVPSRTGLMPPKLSLDRDGSALLSYVHEDASGSAQVYAAAFAGGRWNVHQLTTSGSGTIGADGHGTLSLAVSADRVVRHSDSRYAVDYNNEGSTGTLWIDVASWKVVGDTGHRTRMTLPSFAPSGMIEQRSADLAGRAANGSGHTLAWAAYRPANDRPNGQPVNPQPLYVYSTQSR